MKPVILIILVFIITSCGDNWGIDNRYDQNKINIYLAVENDDFVSGEESDLASIGLEIIPWVKSSDIAFYDWSAHAFFLNKEVEKAKYSGRNFVVCNGNKRLFAGVFWPLYMSSYPAVPSILPDDNWFSPKDVILFNSFGWSFSDVLTDNETFKTALINADLFKEGIEVEITKLKKIDNSTLEYTFQITNNESGNIYLPDPSKLGAKHFHHYTNGVSIQQEGNYFYASGFETEAIEEMKDDWYYKLKPMESITRTMQITGYPTIPTGQVKATFRFPGAYHLETGEWMKPDGRIWIGEYRAETSNISIL